MVNIQKVLLPFALAFKSKAAPSAGPRSELDMLEDQIVQTGGTSPAMLDRYVAAIFANAFERMPRSARLNMYKACNIPARGRDMTKTEISDILVELARTPSNGSQASISEAMKFITPDVLGSVFRLVDKLKDHATQLELQNEEQAVENAGLRRRYAVVDKVLDHARTKQAGGGNFQLAVVPA